MADVPVTIEDIPVLAKAGSILPLGPVRQHSAEKSDEPLTVRIYPGADASFNLFEDDGLSVGAPSSTISFSWDDTSRILTIGKRQGSFEGMEDARTFKIAVAGTEKSIRYDGRKVIVRF